MQAVQTPPWFDSLAEAVVLIKDGRVIRLNKSAARLLDVNPQVSDAPLIAVVRDHRLEEAYLSQQAVECETRGRWLLAVPITEGLLLRDVTEARRARESARELLAVLSHELRTPVSIIRSTFEALRGNVPEQLKEKFLARAETESDRLVRLLEDLTVDVKPPQYRSVVLLEVVERAVSLTQRSFAEHRVQLRLDLEELTVWADSDKLLQVLINLLENAAIHGPDDAVVTLLAKTSPKESGFAEITVQDQGEPLNPERIGPLFEPHARGRGVKAKGTGLGLYIVRSIAERWQGRAWGRPLDAGNEFGITVPLKR